MTLKFYKCSVCGQIVAKVEATNADIICCGQPMKEMTVNTVDGASEKHVPVCTQENNELHVQVGSIDHPMEKEHYIKWIYVQTENGAYFRCLRPGDKPFACFTMAEGETPTEVMELCNIHGLWKA